MGTHQTIGLIGSRLRPEIARYLRPDHDACLLASFQWLGKMLVAIGCVLAIVLAATGRPLDTAGYLRLTNLLVIALALFWIGYRLIGYRAIAALPILAFAIRLLLPESQSASTILECCVFFLSLALPLLTLSSTRSVTTGQVIFFMVNTLALGAGVRLFLHTDVNARLPEIIFAAAIGAFSAGGMLLRADAPPLSVFALDSYAGEMSRRLLPSVVVITFLSAWLRFEAESLGYFSSRTGVSVFAVVTVWLLAAVIYLTCRSLSQTDAVLRLASDISNMVREQLDREVTELTKGGTETTRQDASRRAGA